MIPSNVTVWLLQGSGRELALARMSRGGSRDGGKVMLPGVEGSPEVRSGCS